MTTQTQILAVAVLVGLFLLLWVVADHLLSRPAPTPVVNVRKPGMALVLSGRAPVRKGAVR